MVRILVKDRYSLGQDISDLLCSSTEPLEEIKYLLLMLKQSAFRVLDTETVMIELAVEKIELKCADVRAI